jgi:hypothetical protein
VGTAAPASKRRFGSVYSQAKYLNAHFGECIGTFDVGDKCVPEITDCGAVEVHVFGKLLRRLRVSRGKGFLKQRVPILGGGQDAKMEILA